MKVLLDTEQLTFTVRSQDDFGIKNVGFEWNGIDQSGLPSNLKGERIPAGYTQPWIVETTSRLKQS